MLDYNDLSFPKLCYIISNQRSGYLVIKLRYNPTLYCDCPVKYYAKIFYVVGQSSDDDLIHKIEIY